MKPNSERILLGTVTIPDEAKAWMKFVTKDGKVYSQPFMKRSKK